MAYSNSPTSPTHTAWNTVRKVQIELQLESCISEVTSQNASRREISLERQGCRAHSRCSNWEKVMLSPSHTWTVSTLLLLVRVAKGHTHLSQTLFKLLFEWTTSQVGLSPAASINWEE